MIESSAERATSIVRQVLIFARGVGSDRSVVQPADFLADMEKIARETFPRSIRIECSEAQELWPVELILRKCIRCS